MTAAPSSPVPVGELVAGKYRVERQLGRGGMGVVVAAMHEHLRQRVALKMLLPEAKASPNALSRFLREARAAAAIRGEHVARVLDVGEVEGQGPYIVMEYLEGRDLAAILAERGRLPVEEAVGYVLQACEAIAEAHAAGIVHRDLKPSNLFLATRPDGSPLVKVLDFGISKALLAAGEGTLTTATSFVGSPIYAPPEQLLAAHDVDERADLWSLGTILFEALAGRPPYTGDSAVHVASKIFHEPPASLAELRPDLPPDLCATIMKCLSKKPTERFLDVRELAEALAPYAPMEAISVERVARIVSASSGRSPLVSSTGRVTTTGGSGRRWAALAAIVVGGTAIGYVAFSGHRPTAPNAAVVPSTTPSSLATAGPEASTLEAAPPPVPSAPEDKGASSAPAASITAAASSKPPAGGPKKSPLSVGVK